MSSWKKRLPLETAKSGDKGDKPVEHARLRRRKPRARHLHINYALQHLPGKTAREHAGAAQPPLCRDDESRMSPGAGGSGRNRFRVANVYCCLVGVNPGILGTLSSFITPLQARFDHRYRMVSRLACQLSRGSN